MSCQEIGYPYLSNAGHHKHFGTIQEGGGVCATLRVTSSPQEVAIGVSPVDDFGRGNGVTEFCRDYPLQLPVDVTLTAPASCCDPTLTFVHWLLDGTFQPPGETTLVVEMSGECHRAHAVYDGIIDPPFGACCPNPETDPPPWNCYMTTPESCQAAGDIWYGGPCENVECGTGGLPDCCGLPWPDTISIKAHWSISAQAPSTVHCCACHACEAGNCVAYFPCPSWFENEIPICHTASLPCEGGACGNHIQTTGTCCDILAQHSAVTAPKVSDSCGVVAYRGTPCFHTNPDGGCNCTQDEINPCPPPLDCFIPAQGDPGVAGCSGGTCCNRPFLAIWVQGLIGQAIINCRCTTTSLRVWGSTFISVKGCKAGINPSQPHPCNFGHDPTQDPLGWVGPPEVTLAAPFDVTVPRAPGQPCANALFLAFPIVTDFVSNESNNVCRVEGTLELSL